jgi:hypothetical protein
MKRLFASFFIGFLFMGCASVVAPTTTVVPTSIHTKTALANLSLGQEVSPSPTDSRLPINSEASSDEYCKTPYAVLPVSDGNDISEDEIVYELMRIWLRRYTGPDAPLSCRIDGFTIDKVYFDLDILSRPLEPRGDFMRLVDYAVKPIQSPTDWMSFSSELDQENWLHLRHAVAVFETSEGYTLEFAYP